MTQVSLDNHEFDNHEIVSDEDRQLRLFLQNHRPSVPSPALTLEDTIMQSIQSPLSQPKAGEVRIMESSPTPKSSRTAHWFANRQRLWMAPSAIAASFLVAWAGYRAMTPVIPSDAQLASLESFLESSWDNSLTPPENDSFFISPFINQ
ncbi:MAG: hypothetical protein VKJ46_03365 [Leptolyngbyaceae bacterium]|nr:hypothetical protein [Leptolyngbyaceae bacterium]